MEKDSLPTLPHVGVPSLDRLHVSVEAPNPPTADELIERLYEKLRAAGARRKRPKGESIQFGDDVVCDLVVVVDGEVVSGGVKRLTTLEMRDYPMFPGLVEAVVGSGFQTHYRLEITLPVEYPVERLAGQLSEIHLLVHEVYQVEQPEMDDPEALRAAGLGDNLSSAMAFVAEEIDQEQGEELLVRATQAVLKEFGKRVLIEVDEELIDQELLRVWQESYDEVLEQIGFDDDLIEQAWSEYVNDSNLRQDAELRIKTDAGLRALIAREELIPDPADMERLLEGAASAAGLEIEAARAKARSLTHFSSDLVRSASHLSAVRYLMSQATIEVED